MKDEDSRDLILREIYVVYMPGGCPFCQSAKCIPGCVGQKILEWGSKPYFGPAPDACRGGSCACLMDMERE